MDKYKLTVGLEVHVELKTKTKMFCACRNDPDEKKPNVNICPVCLGHPGTLPVINKEAVKSVLKVGLALGGEIADQSEFDRKNYFYPDIPKGYQISQYKYPLVSGGELDGVLITRVHLEEDTARSMHESRSTSDEARIDPNKDRTSYTVSQDSSLVDFNRAGVPLMELVTEPTMHSSGEVVKFGVELQLLLQYLGVAEANMEKGEMRLEANISISGGENLGTKVEVKNLNSFKSAEKAIEYEFKRQSKILESGEMVVQETRGWDDKKQVTFSQRSKENSHDYRYFPDPDLPKLKLSEMADFDKQILLKELRETPKDRRGRFERDYGIKQADIDFYISNTDFGTLFEEAASHLTLTKDFQLLSNYIVSDVVGLQVGVSSIEAKHLAELIKMVASAEISSRGAKDILSKMKEGSISPRELAIEMGLFQKNDEVELKEVVSKIIATNQEVVLEYKKGKISALQFLVGQGMKETRGSANPQVLKAIFEKLLI